MPGMNCVVVTPEMTVLDDKVDFVVVPLFDGELGIAPGHSPMIGRLGYGEMRLNTGETSRSYFVDGGFVQVADDVVTVLTSRSIPADEVDAKAAQVQLDEAIAQKAGNLELMEIRQRSIDQAKGQLRVAKR